MNEPPLTLCRRCRLPPRCAPLAAGSPAGRRTGPAAQRSGLKLYLARQPVPRAPPALGPNSRELYGAVAGLPGAMEEGGGKTKETPKPKAKKKASEAGKAKKGGDGDGGTPAPKRQKAAEAKAAKATGDNNWQGGGGQRGQLACRHSGALLPALRAPSVARRDPCCCATPPTPPQCPPHPTCSCRG